MNPNKRREGRRIRKNRRQWNKVARAFQAFNDPKAWKKTIQAMEDLGNALRGKE